jgi:eukaryotic-like serine/threonine-protein kinase
MPVGSPYYVSPEQVRREPVDRRADVFSLGVVLYELLTDVKPFRGATLEEIMSAVLEHEPALANVLDPSVPEALAAITAKALAKDPDDRYRSARSFARELRRWLDENTVTSESDLQVEHFSSKKALWIAGMALGALAIGVLVWATMTPRRELASRASANAGQPVTKPSSAAAPTPLAAPTIPDASSPTAISAPPAPVSTAAPAMPGTISGAVPAAEEQSVARAPTTTLPVIAATNAAPTVPAQGASAAKLIPGTIKTPKESAKERRLREARERESAKLAASAAIPAAAIPNGVVRLAVSPWGELEVDGKPAGTSPPLNELSLSPGKHQIVIRNTDLPPLSTTVNVTSDQPVILKYKF